MKISRLQLTSIFICFLMNMLDGMDVMIISYAAPSITASWVISSGALGMVFSAGLLGMSIGAIFLAPRADKVGRKTIILFCNALMGLSVFATSWVNSLEALMVFRVLSGIGIGGVLASTATLTAEYAPKTTKDFWVSFVMAGYPVGAVISGLVATSIIPHHGWQTMFKIAGVSSLMVIPIVYFLLKESEEFLQNTAVKKNQTVGALLTSTFRKPTLWLWLAIFMAFASLYFLTTWIPKLASAAGLTLELAIYAGTIFNMGAFCGIVSQGYLSAKFGLQKTIFCYLLFTAILMLSFGFFKGSVLVLFIFGLLGFGIQGGFVGMYSLAARLYPVDIRATGMGWSVGAGRVGAIAGPLVGGLLIGAGLSMASNFIAFAIPTIIAGIATLFIHTKETI
jgi:AAHS family 4-hydroxybenzoate transporter-like MFS transporter